ncbi:MAG TPA: serine/threonine-protein kinase, partial [Phototrophicaceae bacterium]|nr:serine/threonine-protein kinase [Phototrophicaceae bacterium]
MDNLKGKIFRGYELRDLLGVGGFGVVYRAYQQVVEREVAIKIILPEYASKPGFIRNFEREAQLVARLEHPYIVPLYDYWRDPNGAFIVMRLLRGGSLQDVIKKKGALDLTMTAKALEQIGDALAEAHRNNVVHQDIKAANILLDEQGNTYLTDFGIAKDLSRGKEEDPENGENSGDKKIVHGSPEYMAPEQILNLAVDARTDIYSLGVVIYEMLTGEKPFLAPNDDELVRRQLYEKIPSLQGKRPDLSPNFDLVIQRATDKNPKRRYTTPVLMAENFRQFVSLATQMPTTAPDVVAASSATPPAGVPVKVEEKTEIKKPDPVNPYKGLRAFQEADSDDFFGREKLVERLYLRMLEPGADARFLAVIGPSGSGKSSVVRAGLIPTLRKNLPRWFMVDMTPGAKPIEQLVDALLKVAVDSSVDYNALIRSSTDGLHQAVERGLGQVQGQRKTELVLVIDQFEELFTLTIDENERKHFIDSLLKAIHAEDSRLRVIVTLRADFYDRPLLYPGLSDLFNRRLEAIAPMTAEELVRTIEKPAARVGLELDDNLVSEIIAEVGAQSAPLPLLQYALTELFNQRTG